MYSIFISKLKWGRQKTQLLISLIIYNWTRNACKLPNCHLLFHNLTWSLLSISIQLTHTMTRSFGCSSPIWHFQSNPKFLFDHSRKTVVSKSKQSSDEQLRGSLLLSRSHPWKVFLHYLTKTLIAIFSLRNESLWVLCCCFTQWKI